LAISRDWPWQKKPQRKKVLTVKPVGKAIVLLAQKMEKIVVFLLNEKGKANETSFYTLQRLPNAWRMSKCWQMFT
jgi:hypothetical protein